MRIVVVIASEICEEQPRLRTGDRAAVHWGYALAGSECQVRFPASDRTAWTYAAAIGASATPLEKGRLPQADLLLLGSGAIEYYGDELAGRLAEQNQAELIFDGLQLTRQSVSWKIVCDAGRGARDILQVTGPVVLVVSDQAERPPYVSTYRLTQAAREVPATATDTSILTPWQPVTPRPPRAGVASNLEADDRTNSAFGIDVGARDSRGQQIISDEPAVCAQVLLRYLAHHGFIQRSMPEIDRVSTTSSIQPPQPTTHKPDNEALDHRITIAIQRGPRYAGETDRRVARRPRAISSVSPVTSPIVDGPLQRGPRRLNDRVAAGRRGPFRLMPDAVPRHLTR